MRDGLDGHLKHRRVSPARKAATAYLRKQLVGLTAGQFLRLDLRSEENGDTKGRVTRYRSPAEPVSERAMA
jgi:hypothetical protein